MLEVHQVHFLHEHQQGPRFEPSRREPRRARIEAGFTPRDEGDEQGSTRCAEECLEPVLC